MKYVLSTIGIMVLAIFAVVLLSRNNTSNNNVQTGQKKAIVTDYVNNESSVTFYQFGRVVGNEKRRTLKITVTENSRTIELFRGYQGEIERSETLDNNKDAYNAFLHALDDSGFTREQPTTTKDEMGVCPLGSRFNYELKKNNDTISNLWSTSCLGTRGNFGGNVGVVRTLFQLQIPDYNKVIQGVVF